MKARNVFLVVLFIVVLSSPFVAAEEQELKEAQNAISIDLLWPIISCVPLVLSGGQMVMIPVGIEYQRVISDHFVLYAKGGFMYTIDDGWDLIVYPIVGVDWHPFHKGLKGFHVGLSGDFFYEYTVIASDTTWTAHGTRYSYSTCLGLTLGWQFLLPAHIIMDLALQVVTFGYDVSTDVYGVETSGFSLGDPMDAPGSMLSLGFRF